MAENKYLSYAGLKVYDEKIKALIASGDAEALAAAKAYAEGLADNYEEAGSVATAKSELQALIDALEEAVEKLNGDANVDGSVDKKIATAKSELNETISAVDKKADGIQSELDAAEDEIERVEGKVDDNAAAIGDLETLETTSKDDLVKAINEVRNAVSVGGTAAAITIDTATTTDGMLKSYTIKQGDNTVGTIDIPKDMVVQSGEVVTLADGDVAGYAAGTYIKLTLANATNDVIYVNVGTLVDIYKAQANATQVQLTVDSATREISAVIVAGSVGTAELADGAVTTVKIADGNVTKAKLSTAVQASLDKADAAATKAEFDEEVARAKAAEEKALTDAKAYADEKVLAEENRAKGVESGLDERLQAVETVLGDGDGSVSDQIADAKAEVIEYADGLDEAMNARVEALEAIDHEHANKALLDTYTQTEENLADAVAKKHEHTNATVLNGITAEKVTAWDSAESNAKDYTDELAEGAVKDNADAIAGIKNGTTINNFAGVEGAVSGLDERVQTLENADTYVEITTAEINSLFATNA